METKAITTTTTTIPAIAPLWIPRLEDWSNCQTPHGSRNGSIIHPPAGKASLLATSSPQNRPSSLKDILSYPIQEKCTGISRNAADPHG